MKSLARRLLLGLLITGGLVAPAVRPVALCATGERPATALTKKPRKSAPAAVAGLNQLALGPIAASAPQGNVAVALLRLRADKNITFHATLKTAGASAITLTGTVFYATAVPGIQVRIASTGVPGTGTFDVSYDNGATFAHSGVTIPVGLTYALDGAATGTTINFTAAATYTAAVLYNGVVTTWGDTSGNALNYGPQATVGKCPVYLVAGLNGRACLDFDGTDDELQATHAAINSLLSSTPVNPCTIIGVFNATDPDADRIVFGCGAAVSNNRTRGWGVAATGDGVYVTYSVSNAGSGLPQSPTLASFSGSSKAVPVIAVWRHSATTARLKIGKASELAQIAFAPGTTTLTKSSIGSIPDSSADHFFKGQISEVDVIASELSSADTLATIDDRTVLWNFGPSIPLVVAEGNSIMNGFNTGTTVPARWTLTGWTIFQEQVNGDTLQNMIVTFPLQIKVHFYPGNPYQVVVVEGGNNDIASGRTAAQVEADMVTLNGLISAAHMACVMSEITHRSDPAFNLVADAVNAALLATPYLYGVQIAYIWTALAAAGAVPGSPPYYNADGTHFLDPGYVIIAAVMQAAILRAQAP